MRTRLHFNKTGLSSAYVEPTTLEEIESEVNIVKEFESEDFDKFKRYYKLVNYCNDKVIIYMAKEPENQEDYKFRGCYSILYKNGRIFHSTETNFIDTYKKAVEEAIYFI